MKSGLHAFHDQAQATNKFYLGAIVLSDAVVDTIRRELRRLSDVKIESDDLRTALKTVVLKREVIEGDKADWARRKVTKAAGKTLRNRKDKASDPSETVEDGVAEVESV